MKFKAGDFVTGKKKSISGKRGRIVHVDSSGKRGKCRVAWDDDTEGEYSSAALSARSVPPLTQPPLRDLNRDQTPPQQRTIDAEDHDEEGGSSSYGSESSSEGSDDDSAFGDRERYNELHPEDGVLSDITDTNNTQPPQ